MNADLSSIGLWAERNSLALNVDKTNALLLHLNRRDCVSPNLVLGGQCLPIRPCARNLGLVFDSGFRWDRHISGVCARIYATLRSIRPLTCGLPVRVKLGLCKSLVLPHLTYCDAVYGCATRERLRPLRRAVNSVLRFVYGISMGDPVSHLQGSLLGTSFDRFYDYRALLFVHSVLFGRVPAYLSGSLESGRSLRTAGLGAPFARTESYRRSIFVRGVVLWNSFPPTVRNIRSGALFKKECLLFLNGS